ncbi:prolyl oligopeptidase family serine peptidase [bacterium]|nr:prolyl oligopeptidase family serine peptidase [bacterium]
MALFMTGAHDPRVDPMRSRKMIARLQTANRSGHPIVLRTSSTTGHGICTTLSDQPNQQADRSAFLFSDHQASIGDANLCQR